MEPIPVFAAAVLVIVGLVGQGFEMRRIRKSMPQETPDPKNVFTDRRNFKWYGIIAAGLILYYVAEL
ncbi:MAG: hypothetical protein LV468_03755 [Candidatus Nitrosotenuis sp.]|uniref:hypothetical protein n=1 Tax=Candidatus Nitrosotenuis cloacae TaxID=1603555 RepID=UPI00227E3206|nr:hypothetical protein [Candidatus Nitrosotenuis cloacae]MDC8438098.1 hypothetical protein [Candidatus Nitrosotenuis sp.]